MQWIRNIIEKIIPKKERSFQEIYDNIGIFQYTENGFKIKYENISEELKWTDILQINVYKRDMMTTDRITMEIIYQNNRLTLSEDLAGWFQFVLKTKEIFPSIPKQWDFEIIQPPFERNFRIIYQKGQ